MADHEKEKEIEVDTNPFPTQVNMVDPRGNKPMQEPESPAKTKLARNTFRLCIRCKAEMMEEDWNALLMDVPKGVRKWLALTNCGADTDNYDHRPVPGATEGSKRQSSGEEGEEKEHDFLI